MIVRQVGYLKLKDVQLLKANGDLFSLYKTNKNTTLLVFDTTEKYLHLYYPKQDRLPWKLLEGKKITNAEQIYCSTESSEISTVGWNNNEQIMTYKEFTLSYE